MRRMLVMALVGVAIAGDAHGQEGGVTDRGNRLAYEAAMKCFVVSGNASGEREEAGDKAHSAAYEAAARRSFNAAVTLGGKLGYAGSRIKQDVEQVQARELPKLVKDVAYNRNAAATCRALGLM